MRLALLTLALTLQCCDICVTIRVPVQWDSDSEVPQFSDEPKTSADKVQPYNVQTVPVEYFQYTAKKPQFAVDIAKYHGVPSPEQHFKAYPVRPYTGKERPELGKHKIQDPNKPVFHEFQDYINKDTDFDSHVKPVSANYEVFHPYKAEEPGFQELYKDPVLDKIRNDIRYSSQQAQAYQKEAGKPNIESGEYLESADETDRKKIPHKNIPAPYEIHRPQRRPVYYRPPPKYPNRDAILNKRFRHPWNQNFVKIRPAHYVPLRNHLHRLRQNHALKYEDEHNEYPQIPVSQHYEEPTDGYDIYEKGREKYVQLRNNLDESVNNVAKESRPSAPEKLELQGNDETISDEDDEFVPIKNYAQVRKTETTRHLPKIAAFDEAEGYEEIKNAPRLREAVKSTKAQIVYTEEGYEDSAYDHAGEQKHASDHEAHAGYLKENELSGGKYKIPSVSGSYEDGKGSAYRDQTLHGEKWKENNKDHQKEQESEDYAEDENEHYDDTDSYRHGPVITDDNARNKREEDSKSAEDIDDVEESENGDQPESSDENNNSSSQHDVNKRETKYFKVPEINLETIFTSGKEILENAKEKLAIRDDLKQKYPYYYKNSKKINENSPLRYAENLKFIPKKSKGGTEFYDSRSQLECPEVDAEVAGIPEKLRKIEHPGEKDKETEEGETDKQKGDFGPTGSRLTGLGDKIDCFKAKYFGENPLDSPFFKEEIIANPEPITLPNLTSLKLRQSKEPILDTSPSNVILSAEKLLNNSQSDLYQLLNKLNNGQNKFIDSVAKQTEELKSLFIPQNRNFENSTSYLQQNNIYSDILQKIKHNANLPFPESNISSIVKNLQNQSLDLNTNLELQNDSYPIDIKDVSNSSSQTRKRRAAPFVYEPYKIIRDVQVSDSKKTTTTSNVSPLIKQLQSSKVIDAVVKDQPVKRTVSGRTYKNIGRTDRVKNAPLEISDSSGAGFIDVNEDKRRGEPRYELKPTNHKSQYSPVSNKKVMSIEDYEAQTKQKIVSNINENKKVDNHFVEQSKSRRPVPRAVYDISKFLPKTDDIQKSAASNTVKTTIATSPAPKTRENKDSEELTSSEETDESEEDYDDEYEDEGEDPQTHTTSTTSTTTTTTTTKPIFRRRIRSTTTTEKEEEVTEEPPKLRLVTRFRTPPPSEKKQKTTEAPYEHTKKDAEHDHPKYREKKKKSSKSTLVTDTKKYGNDDDDSEDDMQKEEIDTLIGVKQDMDEYVPMYEKERKEKNKHKEIGTSEEDDSSEEDDDDEDDEEDEEYEDEGEEEEEEAETTTTKAPATTTEVTKRTLVRTTDAPPSTTETRKNAKLEIKPVVLKKKIEIHKELPVNKSSPHVTQYKQDIEEEEIIKEIPRAPEKKQNKNLELLDFYKDENLAKDINQLGGVEVFKEDLDIKKGPKHGGNYRRAPDLEAEPPQVTTVKSTRRRTQKSVKDAVASQSENKKHIELNEEVPKPRLHGGNLKSIKHSGDSAKSEKLIELTTENSYARPMHGGNLKSVKDRGGKRFDGKSEKLIELDSSNDNDDDDDSSGSMHGGNFKSFGSSRSSQRGSKLHGGNYRSAKLVADDNQRGETKSLADTARDGAPKNARVSSAVLLNSFAQAVPIILTTTPAYIKDPSKRMYYYVDA